MKCVMRYGLRRYLAGCGLMLLVQIPLAAAVESIQVLALFSGKAMVSIDGRQRMLSQDQRSPEGVLLISANSREAVLEIDGVEQSYQLGQQINTRYQATEEAEAKIWLNGGDRYTTVGSINGRTVNFLVDTGATSVAMSSVEAKRLAIPYRLNGKQIVVSTASGYARGYAITLDRVKVGDIQLHNVGATVIEGSSPRQVLLGMTFLGRVTMVDQGEFMVLKKKY